MDRAIACLTYDDWYVSGWFGARSLFKQYDARVTFFIGCPQNLGVAEVGMLKKLQDDGHEIGSHTKDHVYLPKWLPNHSAEEYVADQVLAAVHYKERLGFDVSSFAYPHNRFRPHVTGQIMQHLRMVRESGPTENPIHALHPVAGNAVVGQMGVLDITGMELPLSYIEERFDLIAHHGGAGIFCGHAISPDRAIDERQFCSLEDLERILAAARDRRIALRPMRDIGHRGWMWERLETTKKARMA